MNSFCLNIVILGLFMSRVSSWTTVSLSTALDYRAALANRSSRLVLSTGWIDDILPFFLQKRQGDFQKLEDTLDAYGPGPMLLLYNVPTNIDDLEIFDIFHDVAPKASAFKPQIYRINDDEDSILDMPLSDALNKVANGLVPTKKLSTIEKISFTEAGIVLFFSGILNSEMMNVYNILGREIYLETGGKIFPACAKCVPRAMGKPVRQVLNEVIGDHEDAIKASEQ
jgi:hypothetical protein